MPATVITREGVDLVDDDYPKLLKKTFCSTCRETSITSSDSGVVSRQSGGSATIRRRSLARCRRAKVRSTAQQRDVSPKSNVQIVEKSLDRADVEDTSPVQFSESIRDKTGRMADSVFHPAVGARIRRAVPARIGSMASLLKWP